MSFKVVVTGASSGIGRATALKFAKEKCDVAVLARRADLLETLLSEMKGVHPSGDFIGEKCDVASWEEVSSFFAGIEKRWKALNVLVNNAGAFEYSSLEKSSIDKINAMVDVNVRGLIYVTKAAYHSLRNAVGLREKAKVINVSSVSGLWGFANMSTYSASKFAVTGFTSALRREWRPFGIEVASIHPGPVRTYESSQPKKKVVMLPNEIADQVFSLACSRENRVISHRAFAALNALENISPSLVDAALKKML